MSAHRTFAAAVRCAFGKVLKEARKERGLSQEAVAELADLDRTTPSLFERGLRQPTLVSVIVIAGSVEMDPRVLVSRVMEQLQRMGWRASNPSRKKARPEN